MITYCVLYFAYFLEGLIAYFYFNANYKQKVKPIVSMLIIQAFYLLAFVPNAVMQNNNVLINSITFTLTTFLYAIICFEMSVKSSIFHSVIFFFVMVLTEMVTEVLVQLILRNAIFILDESALNFLFGVLISKSLFFIVAYFIATALSYKKNNAVGSMSKTYLNMLYPLTVLFLLGLVFRVSLDYVLSRRLLIITIVFTSGSIALCFITAIYNQRLQRHENELAELSKQQMKNEIDMQYLNLLEKKNQQMQILTHDYKNHILAIRELADGEQVRQYVDKMLSEVRSADSFCNSGNHTLDIIINKYVTECELNHVDFDFDIKLSNLAFVDGFDLVTILGNLLDNALEAAEKSGEKKISFSTKTVNSCSAIVVSNSCDAEPDKNLKTSKKKGAHGFGLKSVEKTIKSYGGDFEWEYDSAAKMFTITVMLQEKAD